MRQIPLLRGDGAAENILLCALKQAKAKSQKGRRDPYHDTRYAAVVQALKVPEKQEVTVGSRSD
jgi:hypothetical protein